jgi:hypothetical protein
MKALRIIGLFFTIVILSGCANEDMVDSSYLSGIDGKSTTAIAISLDDLLPVNMNSRAGAIDGLLSKINDLNIRVTTKASASSGEKYTYIYCTPNKIMIDGKSVNSTKAYYINDNMSYIHCNDIAAVQVTKVQVIANYGKDLYNKGENWNSIVEDGDNNLSEEYCMMYGETTGSTSNVHNNGQGALNCRLFNVKLQRTRAMLTVQLKGDETLKPGVTITPKKISLHNVPTLCNLMLPNKATERTRKDAEVHDINWGAITQGSSAGTHAYSDLPDNFLPLYLFENLQGNTNNSPGQEVAKYPEGCLTVADAKKDKTHSYVEIEAEYRYEENGYLKNSGVIVYRFFLGENDYNDFNVKRNTYYRLTLNLKGFGGAREDGKVEGGKLVVNEKDLSWRVDMDITDWGFEKGEYDFDAHSELGTINVMGNGWHIENAVDEKGNKVGAQSWVRFASPNSSTGWTEPTKVGYELAEGGKIQYYIQPMIFGQDFGENTSIDTHRTITVTVKKDDGKTQNITFTQWVPIKFKVNGKTVFMERFEEEPLQEWGCQNDNLKTQVTSSKLGSKVSYNFGTNISTSKDNGNTWYINDRNLNAPAHIYCYNKSDVPGGAAGAIANYYVLPNQETLKAMIEYFKTNTNSNVEPIKSGEDYWTSSVEETTPTETSFWNGVTQCFEKTGNRNLKKRTRAIYTTNANGIVEY